MLNEKLNSFSVSGGHIRFLFVSAIQLVLVSLMVVEAQPANGANKFLGNITTRNSVRSDFMTYWNQITPENESKWGSAEPGRGSFNWGGVDKVADFAKKNNIMWKFHTLVWGSQYPNWIMNLSQADQLKEIGNWMDAAKAKYPDLKMIDVVNEACPGHAPAPYKAALGGDGASGFDWIFKSFQMAHERWPNAVLIYNDYNNCEYDNEVSWTYKLITKAIENKIPIDAIGCQAHDAFKISTSKVKANIDKLASTGLPIYITEYDIGESNDARQKQIMTEQMTMFWNHPKIVGVTYWGYLVGATWRNGTGLLNSSGSERPALTWLKEYIKANPNPPNDFTNMYNSSAPSKIDIYNAGKIHTSALQGGGSSASEVFDLQGRVSRVTYVNGSNAVPLSSLKASSGCYIIRQDGRYAGTVNKLK